jgi:asparagine synthase (glutamine-hydrolysing)
VCGIAGFYNLSKSNFTVDDNLLDAMQQNLLHRGPDDYGIWKSDQNQIGFAHRRLSIIDLSAAGHQPMLDKKGKVVICFNGEIYNHQTIRAELQSLGYEYFSQTDTETLIYAYQEWGIDFLHKLEGMFAIALFDLEKKELYLIRDRIGIKPLYFSLQDGVLSFASEIKALWQLPWINKEISDVALYHSLTFMVSPAPYTIYDKVYKLPAGFYAKVDYHKQVSFCEWYTPIKSLSVLEQKEFEDENFCLENIENLLKDSTKKRMMSDVPFGAFLSGGVDSSLNVALMSQFISNVKTFTVSFSDGPEFNELKWARLVAKKFGTDHNEIIISEQEAFEFYQKMVYYLDEPLADCVCIPFYYVAKLARDCGVTVAQVGEGADELFFGYSTYAMYKKVYDKFWQRTQKLSKHLKKFSYQLGCLFFKNKLNHLEVLKNWAYDRHFFWGGALAFNEHQKGLILDKNLINKNFQEDDIVEKIYGKKLCSFDSFGVVDFHLKKLKQLDPQADFLKQMTYLELKQRLPELLLMRADKMAMATGLEGRVPFLDHKLVEFMLNVPASLKFKNNQTKYLLKKVAEKYLPKEVIYRKKVGFAAPTVRWFSRGKIFPEYFKMVNSKANSNKLFLPSVKNLEKCYKSNESVLAVQKWTLQNIWALE